MGIAAKVLTTVPPLNNKVFSKTFNPKSVVVKNHDALSFLTCADVHFSSKFPSPSCPRTSSSTVFYKYFSLILKEKKKRIKPATLSSASIRNSRKFVRTRKVSSKSVFSLHIFSLSYRCKERTFSRTLKKKNFRAEYRRLRSCHNVFPKALVKSLFFGEF